MPVTVCHYPPGASKWNKIEHRLFSFISLNWQGVPLDDYATVVSLIGAMDHRNKGLAYDSTGVTLYSVDPVSANLRTIDDTTGATLTTTAMTSGFGAITGATGLATHPITGTLWALLRFAAGAPVRRLATVDPATGITTDVGACNDGTGLQMAGIAWL